MISIAEYHRDVKARLIADPLVHRFDIRRERRTLNDGYLRARLTLSSSDQLEFSEYVLLVHGGIEVVTYSFHRMDSKSNLIRRWDNAPHFPHLPQAPHHVHDGDENRVLSSTPMSVTQVLDEISTYLAP